MTTTRLDIIDRSVEKAHIWINDVAEELGTEDNQRAPAASAGTARR
jgi:hypothetical protein